LGIWQLYHGGLGGASLKFWWYWEALWVFGGFGRIGGFYALGSSTL